MEDIKHVAIDSGTSAVGAGVGVVVAGPPGAVIGAIIPPILSDVLHRMLSKKEKSRVEKVAELATLKIKEKMENGAKPTANARGEKIKELFEGTLLAAKDTYEEKKIPFIAQMFATAPFTNTPIENMVQSLITAEQLSYRQLCVLSVIGKNQWDNALNLGKKPFLSDKKKRLDEKIEGIYQDINYLLTLGIIGQILEKGAEPAIVSGVGFVAPANLVLLYPGRLLFNSMLLDFIDKKDTEEIIAVLK